MRLLSDWQVAAWQVPTCAIPRCAVGAPRNCTLIGAGAPALSAPQLGEPLGQVVASVDGLRRRRDGDGAGLGQPQLVLQPVLVCHLYRTSHMWVQ